MTAGGRLLLQILFYFFSFSFSTSQTTVSSKSIVSAWIKNKNSYFCKQTKILTYNSTKISADGKRIIPKLTNEKKIIKHLKDSYPIKWGRPVLNDTKSAIQITFGITLVQIMELDAANQILVTNIWSKYVSLCR